MEKWQNSRRLIEKTAYRHGEAGPTKAYNQDDATGFIRLNGLRLKIMTKVPVKKSE